MTAFLAPLPISRTNFLLLRHVSPQSQSKATPSISLTLETPLTPTSITQQVTRRRNLAIISHPDAGKSTLTEKLLLYGGAIQQAGSVRARRAQRGVTSDAMAIERERGISITSSVLTFDYQQKRINITDCPGHADFSEDTYRTLSAVDNAVMLIDGGKGLEDQTRKLFAVCRMRKLPTFTFVNKMDRPCLNPFEICDQIEQQFQLLVYPVVWPIGDGDLFRGVYERATRLVHVFERGDRGKKAIVVDTVPLDHPSLETLLHQGQYEQLMENVEILDLMGNEYDEEMVNAGDLTPLFFGSAMSNFGVELFLQRFLEMGISPAPRESLAGSAIQPDEQHFSAQVFKLQANMDPKHRDRLAFIRIFSGVFEKGMKVYNSRLGNRSIALTRPQGLFAADRYTVDVAYAGDVIGLNNPGVFAIGDTLYSGGKVQYQAIPSFSPELFGFLRNPNPSQYKNFKKGLAQLIEEGTVQLLRSKFDEGNEDPIIAAVGQLQFEVVQRRLKDEYSVESKLEMLPYRVARWVGGDDPWAVVDGKTWFGSLVVKDSWNRPVVLFKNEWAVNNVEDVPMTPWAFAPDEQ